MFNIILQGSYHCGSCPVGWVGDGRTCTRSSSSDEGGDGSTRCTTPNICHPEASCLQVSGTVVCSCPIGMVGNGIGNAGCIRATTRNCDSSPCLVHFILLLYLKICYICIYIFFLL